MNIYDVITALHLYMNSMAFLEVYSMKNFFNPRYRSIFPKLNENHINPLPDDKILDWSKLK